MNRQNFESGYPEQQAYDDRRRESERNAGNEHERGEYRAGRHGRVGNEPAFDHGNRRQDWYRNDELHGYGDEGRSSGGPGGSSRQGDRSGPGSGPGSGPMGGNYNQSNAQYGSGSQGYGQYRDPNHPGMGSPTYSPGQSRNPRGYEGYSDQSNERGYSQGSTGQRGYGSGGMSDRYEDPRAGYGGPSQYGYGRGGSRHDGSGQGYSQGQLGYDPRGSDAGGYGQTGYGASSPMQSGYGQSSFGQSGYRQGSMHDESRPRTGRTPKGYTRSDERIREDVNDRLMQANSLDPSEIEVRVESGEVKLTGSVESREEKFLAEQLAESVSGVKDIVNQLRVQRYAAGNKSDTQIEQKRSGASGSAGSSGSSGSSSNTRDTSTANSRAGSNSGSSR